jgi:outer membrane protein OmpA-like peptidoglycan-associated protein
MKTMADELYSDAGSKPQSKLGTILSEEEKKSKKSNWKWLWWLFLLLILGAILWWLFQMKGFESVKRFSAKYTTADTASIKKPATGKVDSLGLDQTSLEAKASWEKTLGGMVEIRLPDGSLIKVPENGTEKRLVEYLEAKCGTSELKKTWFDMDRIIFKSGTDTLKEISNEQIILLAKIFKSYPKKKFKIGGYTDNVGDPEANIRLSAIRAAAAARAIAAIGIDSTRMRYEGYGQEHPICPANDTEECRAKNRRVSIRVDVCE